MEFTSDRAEKSHRVFSLFHVFGYLTAAFLISLSLVACGEAGANGLSRPQAGTPDRNVPQGNTKSLPPVPVEYEYGDIIFQQSQSAQSGALEEGTGSPWTHVGLLVPVKNKWFVAEASTTVKLTPLGSFIKRGRNGIYVVKRLRKDVAPVSQQALADELVTYMKKPYDIFFEWSDDRIYCSELVYKIYEKAMGIKIGAIQKYKEIPLNGPKAQKLVNERMKRRRAPLDLEQDIITPIAMMESPLLFTVFDNSGSAK